MTKINIPTLAETKRRQPSKAAKLQVHKAFDAEVLADICVRQDFSDYADRIDLEPDGDLERFFYYKDNGSDILAVAHLDHVQNDGHCTIVDTAAGLLACSGALDDRLGVYVILELLPKLGITCDWLLTTNEEIGQSTASAFAVDKDYNWMIQFDRGGTDVVMYEYETQELGWLVEDSGARVGVGSYSDICMLEHLGCAGLNWGVGYQDYHSARSHAWLDDTFRMVARFVKFHKVNSGNYIPFDDPYFDERASSMDDDAWGDEAIFSDTTVADCGDEIDLNDPTSYIEVPESSDIICAKCGDFSATA